ncbi:hypothetical protein [Novipirellula caenicola]|uniref:Uncharacterized protein n=1 Tax=Novipirellula caenicola TaxID=1536901 RepID=A0ABP9VHY3_9BACT
MSSPRGIRACGAVIHDENAVEGGRRVSGPITLPQRNAEDFVTEFNRVYASIGWTIQRLAGKQPSPPSDEPEATA